MILRVVILVLALYLGYLAVDGLVIRPAARRRRTRAAALPAGSRDWDRRTDQVTRQLKGVAGPHEDAAGITAFLDTHEGVEAYVEPKTVVSALSVVLVDADGEWQRFELKEDRLLRQLAKTRGLQVFDASRVGYPPRMRRSRGGENP